MAILVYGSLVPDVVFRVPRLPKAGEDVPASSVSIGAAGGGGNIAMALASWGYSPVAGGNSVGEDPLGRWAAEQYVAAGVLLPAGYVSPNGVTPPNGIIITPDGERTIIGNDYEQVTWLPVEDWDGIDAVVVDNYSGEAGRRVIEQSVERGIITVASDREDHLGGLAVVIWSASEHPHPAEAQAAADQGPLVAVTAGPRPIVLYSSGQPAVEVPVESVAAPDSTGAGDVLAAGVVAALSEGVSPMEAVARAATAATRYVADRPESQVPVPPVTKIE